MISRPAGNFFTFTLSNFNFHLFLSKDHCHWRKQKRVVTVLLRDKIPGEEYFFTFKFLLSLFSESDSEKFGCSVAERSGQIEFLEKNILSLFSLLNFNFFSSSETEKCGCGVAEHSGQIESLVRNIFFTFEFLLSLFSELDSEKCGCGVAERSGQIEFLRRNTFLKF